MKIRVARKPANAYQHGNLREALVQAGMKLLSEGGVEDLSLRAAAQLAGVSHAAPYRHFKDKNALVAAVAEQGFRLLSASLRAGEQAAAGGTVRERLRGQGQGYVKFAIEHPGYLGIIFGGVLDGKLTTPELKAAGQQAYHALRDLVAEGITRGELRTADPDAVSLAVWSMVHGLSHLLISRAVARPGLDPSDPAMIEGLVDTVLRLLGEGISRP
jgi:AcrR family transcriptional regulator